MVQVTERSQLKYDKDYGGPDFPYEYGMITCISISGGVSLNNLIPFNVGFNLRGAQQIPRVAAISSNITFEKCADS